MGAGLSAAVGLQRRARPSQAEAHEGGGTALKVAVYETVRKMAQAAASLAASELSRRIAEGGRATFMAATGASQMHRPRRMARA